MVELDNLLRERIATLKTQREQIKAALNRARGQGGNAKMIDAAKIDAFALLTSEKLEMGDTNRCKSFNRSIIDVVEVDEKAIRIIGSKDILRSAIAGKQTKRECSCFLYANGAPVRIKLRTRM